MAAMDPRIAEIMAKLNNKDPQTDAAAEDKKKKEDAVVAVVKPPLTFEDYLKSEKLREWPQRLTSENLLDLSEERELLGNRIMLENELKSATPIDMHVLRSLEQRLDRFDDTLLKYANMVLNLNKDEEEGEEGQDAKTVSTEKENLPLSVPKEDVPSCVTPDEEEEQVDPAFLTEMSESDAVKAHPSRKRKEMLESKESLVERKKTVEHCKFPGYRVGEVTELPSQLEAPHILHRISKAQDFKAGFRKFWKKIFLSEASVAVMQDTFWWIFLENFEGFVESPCPFVIENTVLKNRKDQQSKLFDRIADSFVALFNSVNPEIKDKVFLVYADCLAQSIYTAFYEAFPESIRLFQEEFKQYLCEVATTWISGVKPMPEATKHWSIKRMLPRQPRNTDDNKVQSMREITVSGPAPPKLDMDDFMKQVDHLGSVQPDKHHINKVAMMAIQQNYGHTGGQQQAMVSREQTKMTNQTTGTKLSTFPTVTASKLPQVGSPRGQRESHVIGPGAEIERVRFNLKGRSPLVAHYLHMHQLRDNKPHGGKIIQRTEISKLPNSDLPTYRELITETLRVQDTLSKEYQRVCEDTNQEILKIERQQRQANRKIEKLQKQLLQCKNSMEVKIMSERILDRQDMDASNITLREDDDEDTSFSTHRL